MSKNITDQYQQEITKMLRKPPDMPYIETIEDKRLKLFTELCTLYRDGEIEQYKDKLALLRKSNTI